jgi:hypothetical protein
VRNGCHNQSCSVLFFATYILFFGLKNNNNECHLLGSPGFHATSTDPRRVSISSDFCRLEGLDDASIVPSLDMSSIASFEWIDKEVCFWRAILCGEK